MSIFNIICLILAALCIGACVVYFFLTYNIPVWAALLLAGANFGLLSTIGNIDKESVLMALILAISLFSIIVWWIVALINVVDGTIKRKEDD